MEKEKEREDGMIGRGVVDIGTVQDDPKDDPGRDGQGFFPV